MSARTPAHARKITSDTRDVSSIASMDTATSDGEHHQFTPTGGCLPALKLRFHPSEQRSSVVKGSIDWFFLLDSWNQLVHTYMSIAHLYIYIHTKAIYNLCRQINSNINTYLNVFTFACTFIFVHIYKKENKYIPAYTNKTQINTCIYIHIIYISMHGKHTFIYI